MTSDTKQSLAGKIGYGVFLVAGSIMTLIATRAFVNAPDLFLLSIGLYFCSLLTCWAMGEEVKMIIVGKSGEVNR